MKIELLKNWPWWAWAIMLVVLVPLLLGVKKVAFHFVRKSFAKKNSGRWIDALLKSVSFPISLVILSIVVGTIQFIPSLPDRYEKYVALGSKFLLIIALSFLTQKVIITLYNRWEHGNKTIKTYSGFARILISSAIFLTFFLIFLDTAGISITPAIASLGVASVAIAFALQETLSSLFAGMYLLVDQPVRVGDFIKLEGGQEGTVDSIGWRSVRIRMLTNNIIIIPNAKLTGSVIVNYDMPHSEVVVLVDVGIDYDSNLDHVEKVTLEVARDVLKTTVGAVSTFEPLVRFHTFADFSINMTVVLRAQSFGDQHLLKHNFIKALQQRYQKENIVIPFPIQSVHVRKNAEAYTQLP